MKRVMFVLLLLPIGAIADARNYLDTIPLFWRTVYPDGGEGLYCGMRFRPFDRSYNIEHVFPMSWVTRSLRCGNRDQCRLRSERFNEIESDMHNMYPARADLNRQRGSYPYAEIPGEQWVEKDCDFEIDYRRRLVEPRPASRGNIARAMLYMADRYQLTLYERQRSMLLQWNRDDPVDAAERERNRKIAAVQGNGNPWIERDR